MESHLLQMRGLKQRKAMVRDIYIVASFTDAWIETLKIELLCFEYIRRIFYRCVD